METNSELVMNGNPAAAEPEAAPAPAKMPGKPRTWVQDSFLWKVGSAFAILLGLYHFYTSMFGNPSAWEHRAVHLLLVLMITYLTYGKIKHPVLKWVEKGVAVAFLLFCAVYIFMFHEEIQLRSAFPTVIDMIISIGLVFMVVLACWRHVGPAMAIVVIVFLAYAMFGFLLPGRMKAPRMSFPGFASYLFNQPFGLLGSTTGVSATSVVMFVFFGALLEKSGAMQVFTDIAIRATKKIVGGPAKAAVIACALVGMIQGNAITNVATTGTFAIPLMKKSGYSSEFSGAVEATAATGGMIMPPVMGAAAFMMAEFTSTPYSKIITYAIIPALLYYLGLFFAVHLRAKKWDLKPVKLESILTKKEFLWQGITCAAAFAVLVTLLVLGFSANRSAFFASVAVIVCWIIRPVDRLSLRKFLDSFAAGGRGMIAVGCACIGAAIVVGCIGMTGLGIKVTVLVGLAKANLALVLFLSMVVCIILGMGLPVTASYVLAATTLSTILTGSTYGLSEIPVHMFLMFFATMSAITPPVALASYASAGLAECSPNKVGYMGMLLVLPSFLIPFIFVLDGTTMTVFGKELVWAGKELLLMGSPFDTVRAVATAIMGVYAFSCITEGWMFGKIPWALRALLGVTVICCLIPEVYTDILGIGILLVVAVYCFVRYKLPAIKAKKNKTPTVSEA